MAKLTKKAVREVAAVAANGVTLPGGVGEKNYDERRRFISEAAVVWDAQTQLGEPDPELTAIYREAFEKRLTERVDAECSRYYAAQKALNHKRDHFRQAKAWASMRERSTEIMAWLKEYKLRGLRISNYCGSSLHLTVERAWAVGCSATLKFERVDVIVNPDDPSDRVEKYAMCGDVSWSSTSRTVAEATAAIALYREMVELVAEAEATFRNPVGLYWGDKDEARVARERAPKAAADETTDALAVLAQ
jgi:hypothetical protein